MSSKYGGRTATINDKTGQTRVIEAMIACILLIGILSITTVISRVNVLVDTSDLEEAGENIMNVLSNPEVIRKIVEGDEFSEAQLKTLIMAFLPPGAAYKVSLTSAVTGQTICNATNTNLGYSAGYSAFSIARTATVSFAESQAGGKEMDVMLVMDRSGSMSERDDNGNEKIVLAKQAAKIFVDQLNISRDNVGLASFADEPTLDCRLTNNSAQVKSKIDSLVANGYTNMGGGINKSNEGFVSDGRPESVWAIILLSDGKANRPYDDSGHENLTYARQYALDQAGYVKSLGVRKIYTIGLGKAGDLDEDLLKQIASDETRYYHAPTADQLEDIYMAISRDLLFEVKYDVVTIQLTLLGSG